MQKLTAYLAAEGFVDNVVQELQGVQAVHQRLVLAQGLPQGSYWSQNIWLEPRFIPIHSISAGAKALRALQRNWVLYSVAEHRRAALLQEQLPHVSAKPLAFPAALPTAPLGSWTLLDPQTILASPLCSSPFPHGEVHFIEDKENPPNRAYLKLWEVLTLLQYRPVAGERGLEVGASPGGWTWVLQRLGMQVLAVDRAPLAPQVASLPGVTFRRGNAFSLLPEDGEHFDWIFSDVICYPEKLYQWVKKWVDSGQCRHMLCSIKFQGPAHYAVIREFADIPSSRIFHLFHNKHELTWVWSGPSQSR